MNKTQSRLDSDQCKGQTRAQRKERREEGWILNRVISQVSLRRWHLIKI